MSKDSLDLLTKFLLQYCSPINQQMKELNHVLEAEKTSRADLELYVAVLSKQNGVMSEETDKLHKELKDGMSYFFFFFLLGHEKENLVLQARPIQIFIN